MIFVGSLWRAWWALVNFWEILTGWGEIAPPTTTTTGTSLRFAKMAAGTPPPPPAVTGNVLSNTWKTGQIIVAPKYTPSKFPTSTHVVSPLIGSYSTMAKVLSVVLVWYAPPSQRTTLCWNHTLVNNTTIPHCHTATPPQHHQTSFTPKYDLPRVFQAQSERSTWAETTSPKTLQASYWCLVKT